MPIKGSYLAIAGGGIVLLWSGLAGKKWSDVLRSVIAGDKPGATTTAYQISGTPASTFTSSPGGTPSGPVGGTASKNMAIGKVLAARYGWSTGAEWSNLVALWTRESGWDNHARNPSSGAYGIPQALPPSKMGALANPPVSSATAQIWWGLGYIKGTYGTPTAAETHENANGWY